MCCHFERSEKSFTKQPHKISPVGRNDIYSMGHAALAPPLQIAEKLHTFPHPPETAGRILLQALRLHHTIPQP